MKRISKERFFGFASGVIFTIIFCDLVMFVYNVFILKSVDVNSILSFVLNTLFYIFIARDFSRAKENISFAHYGITALIICDFIFPLIFNFGLVSLLFINFDIGAWLTILPLIAGVIYFIGICIFNRKHNRTSFVLMIVCGAIMAVCSVSSLVVETIFLSEEFKSLLSIDADVFSLIMSAIYLFISYVSIVGTSLLSFVFFGYPFELKKEIY